MPYSYPPGSGSGGASAATQAEMEAASSTTVYDSPERHEFHPGSTKAWATFTGTGTVSLNGSYNVVSITDNGTGNYTININHDFSSGSYFGAGAGQTTGGLCHTCYMPSTSKNVGYVNIRTGHSNYVAADAAIVDWNFSGDQ